MLLDMLTANAAASHGDLSSSHHDGDAVGEGLSASQGSFLTQLPLSLLGSYLRRPSPSPAPSPSSSPSRARSVSFHHAADAANSRAPSPPDRKPSAHNISSRASAPASSRPPSSGSSATTERNARPKTTFLFAKPVQPPVRGKLHLRPKLLLQLHQVVVAQRPRPAYEVIPFSLLPPRSTRRLARAFNTRDRLGPHDLLIVEAEPYTAVDHHHHHHHDKRSDDEHWESREVIAIISRARSDKADLTKADICMNDGKSRWEVSALPNGGYEFNTSDHHGLVQKARWVLKPSHLRKSSGLSHTTPLSSTSAPAPDDTKFTFSTMSASTRRHPIIATLTRNRIDIMDSYMMPSAAAAAAAAASPTPDLDLDASTDTLPKHGLQKNTDDALRNFIIASGILVAACIYSPVESAGQLNSPRTSTSRPVANRTAGMSSLDSPRSASPASTLDDSRHSLHRIFRSGAESFCRSQSTEPPSSPASTKTATNTSPVATTRGRRSTSDANVRSMTGSMRKRYGLALGDQTVPESEEERRSKRSMELLRIRALALPTPIERPSMETASIEMQAQEAITSVPAATEGPDSGASPMSPSLLSPALLSPGLPNPDRARKTQSTYNPIKTAGLWDSGVSEGTGVRSRPTSMLISSERKRKQDRRKRSKSENNQKQGNAMDTEDDEAPRPKKKGDGCRHKLKVHLKHLFRRETAST